MALIQRVDAFGPGGWSVGTKFLLSKEKEKDNPEDQKLWDSAIKAITDEKEKEARIKVYPSRNSAGGFGFGGSQGPSWGYGYNR